MVSKYGMMRKTKQTRMQGFTLIELMIVLAIIGVLVAIAYPSYLHYTIRTKRADMMSEMQNIASNIESKKLVKGNYSSVSTTGLTGDYPRQGTALYTVAVTPSPLTAKWTITATAKANGQMKNDGDLSLNYQGEKCRGSTCGMGNEWRDD